jgi:hypothetical protein
VGFTKDVGVALKNIILINHQLSFLTEEGKALNARCDDFAERLARLEGKFELLERFAGGRKKLPEE